MACRFCGATEATAVPGSGFAVCDDCAAGVRELLLGNGSMEDVFGFEPIDYDHNPQSGDVMYLGPRDMFYQVIVDSEDGETMIYLDPLEGDAEAFPITEERDEIGEAIGEDKFYLVSVESEQLAKTESWWESAVALAPRPEIPGEEENGEISVPEGESDEAEEMGVLHEAATSEEVRERIAESEGFSEQPSDH